MSSYYNERMVILCNCFDLVGLGDALSQKRGKDEGKYRGGRLKQTAESTGILRPDVAQGNPIFCADCGAIGDYVSSAPL